MTETLVAGQNTVWGSPWCAVELPGAALVALPLGPDGRAVLGQPLGSGRGSVGLDLAGLPAAVTTVMVTALDGVAATAELLDGRGVGVVRFVPAPVGPGAAVAVVELYRRGDGWKVRALGRAYGGGPAAVEALHGVPVGPVAPAAPAPPPPAPLAPPAPPVPPAAPPPAAPPPAAPPPAAPGELVDPDRAAQLVGMVLEDTARSRASYESSTQFADRTLEAELERIVGDPALRLSAAGDAARAAAQARRDDLVARARQAHVRDLATLRTEVEGLERTFPAALARWDVVATRPPGPGDSARAFRAGHLTVPGLPDTDFALPMVLPVPARPVLVTTDDGGEGAADRVAALLGVRAALAMRTGRPRIVLVDLARTRGSFGLPPGLAAPSVTTPPALTRLLGDLERRTALVDAAREAGAFDALDPQVLRPVVVVLADAPTGWETPALTTLARLVRGGTPGVQLVLTGPERPPYVGDEAATELARQVWASALHLPSAPGGSLVDAFARTEWTFVPEPGPADPSLLVRVLASEGPLEGWHDGIIPVP